MPGGFKPCFACLLMKPFKRTEAIYYAMKRMQRHLGLGVKNGDLASVSVSGAVTIIAGSK